MDPATRRIGALLAPLTNYEQLRPDAVHWSLDSMRRLMECPGAPPRPRLCVQVGGSKGKGTTAAYLESLAGHLGFRTGVFASPHVESILERVRVSGENVSEELLTGEIASVLDAARRAELDVTFFEVMTAAALGCFARAEVELAVLEVGLGGRLDATTAVDVDASIVTGVELEHTEILGETIEEIAAEKAYVLRPGRPGFVAADGASWSVLARHAERVGAQVHRLGSEFGVDVEAVTATGKVDDPAWLLWTRDGARSRLRVPGAPSYEARAAALAWACLRSIGGRAGLPAQIERPHLPGRFEVFARPDGHPLVLDGAHTEVSMRLLDRELTRLFPGVPRAVLCGMARAKRWRESLSCLSPGADSFLVTGLSGTRSEDPEAICAWLAQQGHRARAVPDAAAGLRALDAHQGVRVVTGSFYLLGEVRQLIRSV